MNQKKYKFSIESLGEPTKDSPVELSSQIGDSIANYTFDSERTVYKISTEIGKTCTYDEYNSIEKAGPRKKIYFDPEEVHAAILTCGGLCPGLNDVIRAVVRTLWESYGVRRITGVKYGYNGFLNKYRNPYIPLDRETIESIHNNGGSFLGSSRGGGDKIEKIVDSIQKLGINMIFIIGGDGTQKGTGRIAQEAKKRDYDIAVIGIPKTVDNDLCFIDRSFGFETAVAKATDSIKTAHQEAESAYNGIGLVKLMGRNSGFIAAYAGLASHEANFVLIPEVTFDLEGENGLLMHLKKRLEKRHHVVVVVAEGAGIELFDDVQRDESGNVSYNGIKSADIGSLLYERIVDYFDKEGMEITLKYINPSYIVRSAVTLPNDSLYCTRLAANAVHAGMAGKTNMMISMFHNEYVHLPVEVVISEVNKIDPEGTLWRDVLSKLHMPISMTNKQ